jgi:hypothetical protein
MATTEAQLPAITVPATLLAEAKELARSQERSLDQVLTEALNRYVRHESWKHIQTRAQDRARQLGLTEDDVERLIAESRRERGELKP